MASSHYFAKNQIIMPAKILIVDDEPDIVEFIQYNLEREGFDTETAYNGEEAIAKARSVRPDIIILDVMMPVMDGIEACRIIKEDERIKNTFVVFLTARSEEYSELAGFEVGADDYISKPFEPKELLLRIKVSTVGDASPPTGLGFSLVSLEAMNVWILTTRVKFNHRKELLTLGCFSDFHFSCTVRPGKKD